MTQFYSGYQLGGEWYIIILGREKEQGEGRRSFSKSLYVVARMTRAPLLGNQREHIYLDFQGIEWQQI